MNLILKMMDKKFLKDLINKLEKEDTSQNNLNSKILIIDGLNTFLRSFAVINQLNSNYNHIGGLTGFLKSVGYSIDLLKPTRVIIVFDGPGATSAKKNLYPEYKGNRNPTKITNYSIFHNKEDEVESMKDQMSRLMQYLNLLPLDILCIQSVEADDVIGHLVERFEKDEETKEITIMSADQDFLQLVSNKTQIYSPTKKLIYDTPKVINDYQIHPNNFIIKKTLLGDDSDNIPGVDKLGPKKFQKFFPELLEEKIYNLDYIIEKSNKNLEENKLYSTIINFEYQLKINYKLMNLKDIFLTNENITLIENVLLREDIKLNKANFLIMYNNDNLGEAIPNVYYWISKNFNTLNILRQKI